MAEKLRAENGLAVDPEDGVMGTAGSCEAVCVVMLGYVNPGDEVLIPTPAWPAYAVVPGEVFGQGGEHPRRLSFACATPDVKDGVARMADARARL